MPNAFHTGFTPLQSALARRYSGGMGMASQNVDLGYRAPQTTAPASMATASTAAAPHAAMYSSDTTPSTGEGNPPPVSSGNDIYDAIVNVANHWHPGETWTTQYKDQLMNEIAAAVGVWGHDRVLGSLTGSWPAYAMQIAMAGLGLGPQVLNRHDPTHAGAMYVPGFGPQGGEFVVPENAHGLWTDPATGKQYYVY